MELSPGSFAQRIVRLGVARTPGRTDEAIPSNALPPFDRAIEHFAHRRWREAYEELARLADAGHPHAARIALLMATRGPRLFGQAFAASPARQGRWRALASAVAAAGPE